MVVASQRKEPVLLAPRSVDVLGPGDLRRMAPRTTPELLMETSGVVVQKTNHGGGSPYIRGLTGQHVLYLLDGVRLNSGITRYGPNQALNTVDPFTIRKVELLRGPGSLLYGSDALGGVVSLLGRQAPYEAGAGFRLGGEATARFGSADMSQAYNLGVYSQIHRVTLLVGGSYKDFNSLTGGRSIGAQDWTGYDEGSYDAAVTARFGGVWAMKLATSGLRQSNVPRTDRCTATDFRYYRRQHRDLVYAKLTGSHGPFLERLEITLSYQRHLEERDRFRLLQDRIDTELDQTHTAGLSVVGTTHLGRLSTLVYGLDLYVDRVASEKRREGISTGESQTFTALDRRGRFVDGSGFLQGGVFLADTLLPTSWLRVQAGGRFAFSRADIPPDPLATSFGLPAEGIQDVALGFGGGLSLTFIPTRGLHLIISAHHAFRAPNLDDYSHVGSEGPGFDVPSHKLSPEQATTLEMGLKYRHRWLSASLFAYYTWLRDFIARRFTGDQVEGQPATERANMARGYVAGLEGHIKVHFSRGFELATWLSYARGDLETPLEDPATQPISRMSPLQGFFGLGYRSSRGHWALAGLRWSARQHRLSPGDKLDPRICPDGPERCQGTPGFAVISLSGGLALSRYVHLTLRLENVTNEAYRLHGSGLWAPGISAVCYLQVRY